MFSTGRLIGIGFGLFAVVCLVFTYDYSRGRLPETASPMVSDVLAATTARDCGRDATAIVQRYIPLGAAQAEAERILAGAEIVPPKPWFWKPVVENATTRTSETFEALRTIKTTAFGNNLLRVHLTFSEGKVARLAAEVVCRFD